MRWLGVKGSLSSSLNTYVVGMEFNIPSMSTISVSSSSYVTVPRNNDFLNIRLVDWTNCSQKLPHYGDGSIMNFHLICNDVSSSLNLTSSFLKQVALSEIIRSGIRLLEIKRLSDLMTDDALISCTRSKWTTRVVAHVYHATWTLAKNLLFDSAEL